MADTVQIERTDLAPYLGGRSFEDVWADYERDGYVIFENLLSADEIAAYKDALAPYMVKAGRNNFEGLKTNRVYALLAKSLLFADMVSHPLALAFAEQELGSSFLLSACLAINLHPGETVQPWHSDDGYVHMPPPRQACAVSAFWTLDDTTEENGATELLPGSHLWDKDHPDRHATANSQGLQTPLVKATMPAGSLMLAKGTLLHRGGANTSGAPRLIVTPQYCAGWMRQIENLMLSTPKEVASALPQRVRELIGYSIHPPFIGYVDGMHPQRSL